MPGELDQAYVLARKALLDALQALREQLDAVILVGAQAIYLHTGEADIAVLPYTTDADLALDPRSLADDPKLEEAMLRAGFVPHESQVGIWIGGQGMQVDLLVPAAVGGSGRRAARLGAHGKRLARKVLGLEAALVDRARMTVGALEVRDKRQFDVLVASPAALLVAKTHKLGERKEEPSRQDDKDAFDVYRLLHHGETTEVASSLRRLLTDPIAGGVTQQGLAYLRELFGTADSPGSRMAGRHVEGVGDPEFVIAAVVALANDLLDEVGS
ncbi:MAG: hypothetical protein ABI334_01870 [Candidatus Dormiibacterota bacterium]